MRRRDGYRREDEKPARAMVKNCRPFLEAQVSIVNPKVVVLLGSFALKEYARIRKARMADAVLHKYVGRVEPWLDRRVIVLPHTSGLSYWLNDPEHRKQLASAKNCLAREAALVCQ
jgi:uracil-DNA glycosylase